MHMKKIFFLVLSVLLIQVSLTSQEIQMEKIKTALVIIDIQKFYFPSEDNPGLVGAKEASFVAKEVLELFREKEQLVIHVRHQSDKGFAIHPNVKPIDSERVITKTEINAFLGTDLKEYLHENNITRLVVIGMQTQMCLEAAVRAGHDYGFECIVVEDACATRDLKFNDQIIKAWDVHNSTLATLEGGGYGQVINLETFGKNVDKYLFHKLN